MLTLIAVGPDADTAERNIRHMSSDMLANVHKSYREYHDMVEAQRHPRQ